MSDDTLPKPELDREIATTQDGRDITRQFLGALQQNSDSVLRARGAANLKIYTELKTDDQVGAVFGVRQRTLISKEFIVEPGGKRAKDKLAADSLRAQIDRLEWNRITQKMHWGVFYGYSVAEVIYGSRASEVVIKDIRVRDRARFRFAASGELRMLKPDNMVEGVPCLAPYFWAFQTGADHDDEPYGLGLAHWLYWPVYLKRHGVKSWLLFLDKFGSPTGVGKYPQNASTKEKADLLNATQLIKTASGVIIPEGMTLDLLEASRSGTGDYQQLTDTMNRAIAKLTLGQAGTTEGSAQFKLDKQADVAEDVIEADDDVLSESFMRSVARHLTNWNYPGAETPLVYRAVRSEEDLNRQADRVAKISSMGFKPTLASIKDQFGGEWVEVTPTPSIPSAAPPAEFADAPETPRKAGERMGGATDTPENSLQGIASGFPSIARGSEAPNEGEKAQDFADALVSAVSERTAPQISAWLAQVQAMVASATSYTDLEAKLIELTDLPIDEIGQLIAEASAIAALSGQAEVLDGSKVE